MRADHRSLVSLVPALVLMTSVPLVWIACGGGETKPAESPSTESSSSASKEAPAADMPAPSASSAPAADTSSTTSAAPETTSAPPPPSFGSTDCGACIDKTCEKPAAACGKNPDCKSTLDGIHSCSSGAASCIDGATAPTAAKPKKLATAYETCAKKAVAKACKAKCP